MVPIIFNNISSLFTSNLTIKLLSLAVALAIWSFTAVSREINFDLVLPVELRNIPAGYIVSGKQPMEVRFTLHGPSLMIDGARRSNTTIILNLRGTSPGRTGFAHLESYLKLPEGVKVTRISPSVMELELVAKQISTQQGDQQ